MIPSLSEVLVAHARFARRHGLDPRRNEVLIAEALRLAVELAAGRPEDEPAALLFALSLRWNALGAAWDALPIVYARNLAAKLGLRLDLDLGDDAVGIFRLRIITGDAPFDEVRAWVAAHLRPASTR
jgi:hypothetical protein